MKAYCDRHDDTEVAVTTALLSAEAEGMRLIVQITPCPKCLQDARDDGWNKCLLEAGQYDAGYKAGREDSP